MRPTLHPRQRHLDPTEVVRSYWKNDAPSFARIPFRSPHSISPLALALSPSRSYSLSLALVLPLAHDPRPPPHARPTARRTPSSAAPSSGVLAYALAAVKQDTFNDLDDAARR
ncbi:hypothetical protein FB451DRAFT_1417158 [Mycena latifolia]|nr:hypothetical protein FB451DRAFT_1417158 [Mycena latifolia]